MINLLFFITLFGFKFNGRRWVKTSLSMKRYSNNWDEIKEEVKTSILPNFPSYHEGYSIELIEKKEVK